MQVQKKRVLVTTKRARGIYGKFVTKRGRVTTKRVRVTTKKPNQKRVRNTNISKPNQKPAKQNQKQQGIANGINKLAGTVKDMQYELDNLFDNHFEMGRDNEWLSRRVTRVEQALNLPSHLEEVD